MELSKMFGVERDVDFKVKGYESLFKVILNGWGEERLVFKFPRVSEWDLASHGTLCSVIFAAPAGIIHLPPPLTDEQREQLKALWTLGYRWLAKDRDNNVYAYGNIKPIKECDGWGTSNGEFARIHEWMPEGVVASFVSWSDPEPFDIGKALGVGE